jgi:hypothetical protein
MRLRSLVSAGVSVMLGNDNCYDIWCGVSGQAKGLTALGLDEAEAQEAAPDMLRRAAAAAAASRHGEGKPEKFEQSEAHKIV